MADATLTSSQRLQRLADSNEAILVDRAAFHGRLDSIEALLLDIARRLALKDSPAEIQPGTRIAESGIGKEVSQRPAAVDDYAGRRPAFEPNRAIQMLSRQSGAFDGKKLPLSMMTQIDISRFNGENPIGWLYKTEQFFAQYEMSDIQRFTFVFVYMDDPASSWFQGIRRNLSTWTHFTKSLLQRFGPCPDQDPTVELTMTQQSSTVQDGCDTDKDISSDILLKGQDDISSSNEDITSIQDSPKGFGGQAFQLEKLVEDRLAVVYDQPSLFSPLPLATAPPLPLPLALLTEGRLAAVAGNQSLLSGQTSTCLLPSPVQLPIRPPPEMTFTQPPLIRLSPSHMAERRSEGLCFNEAYDEPGITHCGRASEPVDYG